MIARARKRVTIAFSLRAEGRSGVQTHTRLLHEGLSGAGFDCSLVTPFSGSRAWLPVFAVRPVLLAHLDRDWSTRWHRHWHFAALRANLRRELSREPPDVVVAQCAPSAIAALEARAALGASFPIVLVCHFTVSEAEELREKGELHDPAVAARIAEDERQAIEAVDLVVHDSEWQRMTIEGMRALRPRRSMVIWHGIPPLAIHRGSMRAALGYRADDVVLANVGTLEPRKNQLALLEVFARLASRYPRARLLLVGGDGPHRRAIERRISREDLVGRVRLLVDWPDVHSVLESADLYVHHATIESFGLVLLEAARAGLPVAAVPVGGVREVLERLGGVPLDASDPARSEDALRPLLEDVAARRAAARRAHRAYERAFTLEHMIDGYRRAIALATDGVPWWEERGHQPSNGNRHAAQPDARPPGAAS